MDFAFTEVQEELRALTGRILSEQVTLPRLRELEAGDERIDRRVWKELAEANLLGIALPESAGGSGYGIMELAVILEQVGRHVAPVPVLPTVVAAMAIAQFGTDAAKKRYLPAVVDGTMLLTAAQEEPGSDFRRAPHVSHATPYADGGWRISGEKLAVPWGAVADTFLIPATTSEDSVGVFIVDGGAAGLTVEASESTHHEPQAHLVLDGVVVDPENVLGDPLDPTAVAPMWLYDHSLAGICATAAGLFDEAVRITARYVSEREQFGRPIATFQGAALRAADAYIDAQAIAVATWSAIWRLAEGRPAADQLAMAKFWVADGGQRVAAACQHLHGGIGVDTDYPIHRYFLWAKELELALGGATTQLLRLSTTCSSD